MKEGEGGGVTDDEAELWRGGLSRSSHSFGGGLTPDSTVHSVSSMDATLHWRGEPKDLPQQCGFKEMIHICLTCALTYLSSLPPSLSLPIANSHQVVNP